MTRLAHVVGVAAVVLLACLLTSNRALAQAPTDAMFQRQDVKQWLMDGANRTSVQAGIVIRADAIEVRRTGIDMMVIPYRAITSITYDRRARVRVMAPTWNKRQQHFLTIQFKDNGGAGAFIELEMTKGIAPNMVAMLEARSGHKIDKIGG